MISCRDGLETAFNNAWYHGANWTLIFLPLIPFVMLVTYLRRAFRTQNDFAALGAPVVVIGGLTAGGTGKTPTLIALARYLTERGFRVGVVSRGYGRTTDDSSLLVSEEHTHDEVGDEPLLIKRSTTNAHVIVGKSRKKSAKSLIQEFGVHVILSDDGLQHYDLPRDFEVAVIDSDRGLGNGWLQPVGPLREPRERLFSVDFVLERNGSVEARALTYAPKRFVSVKTQQTLTVDEARDLFMGTSLVAATGLGQPTQFFTMLRHIGLEFTEVTVADHALLPLSEIQESHSPRYIVVTAKDAVKMDKQACDNVWLIDVEAQLPEALLSSLEQLLDRVARE
ncbi:MAG: tetraacyldisaccharide 4'-kinase [Pseudomonadota bacterium]|nr:tetraacyldisaccharide 4'-kinase [Pseudomonadota bacterium]